MEISLDLSYQYKLNPTLANVIELFYLWPYGGHEDAYYKISRNTVRDVVAKFDAFEFVYNRTSTTIN